MRIREGGQWPAKARRRRTAHALLCTAFAIGVSLVANNFVQEAWAQCAPDTFTIGRDGATPLVAVNASGFWACGQTTEVCSALASAQARVTGACNSTAAIRAVNADGTVACSAVPQGDVTGVAAGAGLAGVGSGSAGNVTLRADTDFLQRCLAGNCTAAGAQAVAAVGPDGTVTCVAVPQGTVTGVTPGPGLAGGGNSGDVALSADTGFLQRRAAGACSNDGTDALTGLAADGTVECSSYPQGDITGVAAGSGLTGGATAGSATLSVDTSSPSGTVQGKNANEELLFRGVFSANTGFCEPRGSQYCTGITVAIIFDGTNECSGGPANAVCLVVSFDPTSVLWNDGNPLTASDGYDINWTPLFVFDFETALPFSPYLRQDGAYPNKLIFHVGELFSNYVDAGVGVRVWKVQP